MRRLTTLLIALLTITVFTTKRSEAQFYSASTNLPVLATGSINAELSMTLNRNWSLHLEGSVNPWKIEQFRIQHLAIRPAIRWWTSESYRGWFMGAHFCGAYAHIGIPKWMDKKYEGVTMGGGLDLGYAWAIDTRWNIELGLGAGAYYLDMWSGKCHTCSYRTEELSKWIFIPDKLSLSVVYLF